MDEMITHQPAFCATEEADFLNPASFSQKNSAFCSTLLREIKMFYGQRMSRREMTHYKGILTWSQSKVSCYNFCACCSIIKELDFNRHVSSVITKWLRHCTIRGSISTISFTIYVCFQNSSG